ncbi:prepilin-type N-terminal cleavage/methylation domain-containing protein [Opitutaceae bacterium TAV1]|nr:prepilin-type N-terminal cleavage/methylation domain-containing protein [Opitutaceae bacterium TAV1]
MNPRAVPRPLARDAFTLVELLTVVAIIGILAGIMIPTVSKVRKTAQTARCISNLRGLGGALALFAVDNKDKLPPRNLDAATQPVERLRYWNSRLIDHGIIKDRNAFYCPSAFPSRDAEATAKIEEDGGQTYGMRMWMPPGGNWGTDRHRDNPLTAIETPSDFFLIADSIWLDLSVANNRPTQGYGLNPTATSTKNQRIHLRHGNRANALFADFHVAAKDAAWFTTHVTEIQAAWMNPGCAFTTLGENDSYISPP